MTKKNNLAIIIIAIIILAIIAIIVLKKGNPKIQPQPLSQSDTEINQAVASDTTQSIADSLNSINMGDTTDADLVSVDQELGKL